MRIGTPSVAASAASLEPLSDSTPGTKSGTKPPEARAGEANNFARLGVSPVVYLNPVGSTIHTPTSASCTSLEHAGARARGRRLNDPVRLQLRQLLGAEPAHLAENLGVVLAEQRSARDFRRRRREADRAGRRRHAPARR